MARIDVDIGVCVLSAVVPAVQIRDDMMQGDPMVSELTTSTEKIAFILVKAREFDEKVAPSGLDRGSNPADDSEKLILEAYRGDPTLAELEGALGSLNEDEQLDLVALAWLGRGDFETFEDARDEAAGVRNRHIPDYLIGTPQLGDYLEEGLAQLGVSLDEFEINRL